MTPPRSSALARYALKCKSSIASFRSQAWPLDCAKGWRDRLELTAIADLAWRRRFFSRLGFKRHSHVSGARESPADIPVFRTGIESNQPIAVLAVRLKPVADFLRPLPEYLRAFCAFDFYFFVDHEMFLMNGGSLLSLG
jgi:hypothetical protein